MGPSIEISNLNLSYGNNSILQGIHHQFSAGQCHILMGPNGGGKTSLIRSILGLTPFKGEILIHWEDHNQQLGYVPQKAMFEPSLPLTVEDFIRLNLSKRPLFWRKKTSQLSRALNQLERVGMHTRLKQRMGALSGGEQQRVMLAQALLNDPALLILDEPTTGMDEVGVRFFESALAELIMEGKTILAVHHDIAAVKRISEVVHVVNRNIVDFGPAEQVLSQDRLENLFMHHSNLGAKT